LQPPGWGGAEPGKSVGFVEIRCTARSSGRAGGSEQRRRRMRRKTVWFVATMSALMLVAAACGGDGDPEEDGGRPVVRFAFSPDPVIDWMNDQGIIPEYEDKWNVRLVTTSTWDEFTFFAGGHGDIVSMATYETPLLEQETGIETVTFGAYNNLRVPVFVLADNPADTLDDLAGATIAVPSTVSSTIVWGMFSKDWYGLDFCIERPDGSDCADYDLIEGDHFENMDLLLRGEIDACVCIPEAAFPYWRTGEVKALYDPTHAPWQLYEQEYAPGHKGLNGNNFVARADWFDSHPNEVAFFLDLWERGIQEWQENKEEIIRTYPQHFAVESEEDIDFAVQYMEDYDFFVPTVILDEEWVTNETQVYELMKQTGWMDADAEIPRFVPTPLTEP
jgi:ABC-type nitrate/sulfonate/bicarbonate transport system substrate-binding protein